MYVIWEFRFTLFLLAFIEREVLFTYQFDVNWFFEK